MKSGRLLYRLQPSMRRTGEIASGLLLTPTTEDYKSDGEKTVEKWREAAKRGKRPDTSAQRLRNQIAMLPTPNARDHKSGKRNSPHSYSVLSETIETRLLPTFKSSDVGREGKPGLDTAEMRRHSPNTNAIVGARTGLRLQPAFVEWMMGYQQGWTDLNFPSPNTAKKD